MYILGIVLCFIIEAYLIFNTPQDQDETITALCIAAIFSLVWPAMLLIVVGQWIFDKTHKDGAKG